MRTDQKRLLLVMETSKSLGQAAYIFTGVTFGYGFMSFVANQSF